MDMIKAHLSVVTLVDGEVQTSFWLVGRKVMRHMTWHHRYGLWCLAIWRRVRVHFTSSCALQKNGRYWLGFCSLLHGAFLLGFNYECRCLLACCVDLLSWTFLIPGFRQVFLPYPYSKSHAVQWRLFERLFTDFRDCLSQFDYFHVLSQAKHKFELIPPAWLGYWTIIVILLILDRKKLISFCSCCCTMSRCAHFSPASSYLSCAQSHVHNNSVGGGPKVIKQKSLD
jgi:hypothetical protein